MELAVRDALRNPCSAFAEGIRMHFRHKKAEVLQQCNFWMAESVTTKAAMANVIKDIEAELAKL